LRLFQFYNFKTDIKNIILCERLPDANLIKLLKVVEQITFHDPRIFHKELIKPQFNNSLKVAKKTLKLFIFA